MKILLLILLPALLFAKMIPLQLRHAFTPAELTWGLMNCPSLEPNEGMTFTLPAPTYPSFWMFNCKMDLSVAYLSKDKVIREIHEMKAYPQKMDPKRPVRTLSDLALYPPHDPIRQFFSAHATPGKTLTYYALEMNPHFFQDNQIEPGDLLVFDPKSSYGYITKAVDLTPFLDSCELIPFEESSVHCLFLPQADSLLLSFYDPSQKLLSQTKFSGGPGNTCITPPNCAYFKLTR